jgi:hypothetical protein
MFTPFGRWAAGFRVTTESPADHDAEAASAWLLTRTLSDAGATGSEKVSFSDTSAGTPIDALAGSEEVTLGGTLSTQV